MIAYLLLTGGAAFALVCITAHSLSNYGKKNTLIFLSAATIYGILRHICVWFVTVYWKDSVFPYQFIKAPVQVFGISPLELGGWILVAYIGWQFSILFLRRTNLFLISFVSFFIIASISLAVETTAIEARWWFWNLALGEGIFGKVPLVGLIDWGFVGIEFLLPYLVWFYRRKLDRYFFPLLLIFPLHFSAHTRPGLLWFLPFRLQDLIHYAILFPLLIAGLMLARKNWQFSVKNRFLLMASFTISGVLLVVQFILLKTTHLWQAVVPFFLFSILAFYPKLSVPGISAGALGAVNIQYLPFGIPGLVRWVSGVEHKKAAGVVVLLLASLVLWRHLNIKKEELCYASFIEPAARYYRSRDYASAEVWIKKALACSKRHPEAYYYLASALRFQGKWEEAAGQYKLILEKLEYDPVSANMLIASYMILGRVDQARQEVERMLFVYPDEPVVNYLAGNVYNALGEKQKAIGFWIKALEPGSKTLDPLMAVQAWILLGYQQKGVALAHQTLTLRPQDEEMALWLEQYYRQKNDFLSILKMYDDLARRGRLRSYVFKVGEYALLTGNSEMARRAFSTILAKEPNNQIAQQGMEKAKALQKTMK